MKLPDSPGGLIPRHERLAALVERHAVANGVCPTAIEALKLYRFSESDEIVHQLWSPGICFIVQGRKRIWLGQEVFEHDISDYLVLTVDLPLGTRPVLASRDQPYLGFRIDFDPLAIAEAACAARSPVSPATTASSRSSLAITPMEEPLTDAVARLLELLDSPEDIAILAPLIQREILHRVVTGPCGALLQAATLRLGPALRISQAINWLKAHYASPLQIETLARESGMSASSFHAHFKAVTNLSPLQYQKRLRLQQARQLMLSSGHDAASAALEVGYDSASQFGREYKRLYGESPGRDIRTIQSHRGIAGSSSVASTPPSSRLTSAIEP